MTSSGILLHIISLPGPYGIGDFGPNAYKFIDYLKTESHKYWQILPLSHCGYGNSPYNPISAFAIDPHFVSPELLSEAGLVEPGDLLKATQNNGDRVSYAKVQITKSQLWSKALAKYQKLRASRSILSELDPALIPYVCFRYLSDRFKSTAWYNWPEEYRRYSKDIFDKILLKDSDQIRSIIGQQQILQDQYKQLKDYANHNQISIIGDMPLYLSYDSAELWAYQDIFKLDSSGKRISQAGVPPDAFSTDGQLWGNPIYRWDKMSRDGFSFFIERIDHAMQLYDILRLDHFIGLVNYWEVPGDAENAIDGTWKEAMPEAFFTKLLSKYPVDRFIAEDLGILNEKVCHYRDTNGFSGMIVLQFCFEESVPEPQFYPPQCIIYAGTHDNKTSRQWFNELAPDSPSFLHLKGYYQKHPELGLGDTPTADNVALAFQKIALSSPCRIAIIPMQDVLNLGASARMNIPGTALGNWEWRMPDPPGSTH